MKRSSDRKIHQTLTAAIKRFFKKQPLDPDDPYALVTAPKKPRPPTRSAAVAVEPER